MRARWLGHVLAEAGTGAFEVNCNTYSSSACRGVNRCAMADGGRALCNPGCCSMTLR
jgi:hypothetical protein